MVVGSGSKGKEETVSTVGVEMASNKEAEEKPAQAEEDWWSSSDSDESCETYDSEDEAKDEEEGEIARAQWFNTDLVAHVGHGGVILVLFETPSGFAIFCYDGMMLYKSDAHESVWADFVNDYAAKEAAMLIDFRIFEDKNTAIDQHNGISEELCEMISKHIMPDQKLAVAKEEYKTIIEKCTSISCLYPPCVDDLMWGLKLQMRSLVPEETKVGSDEDRLPMCLGLFSFLKRGGFDIKQDMKVSRRIIEMAGFIYECECRVNRHKDTLLDAAMWIKEISAIDAEGWDLLKIATALMVLCFPTEKHSFPSKLFPSQELETMKRDAPKYENKLFKFHCMKIHGEIYGIRTQRIKFFRQLVRLIKRAKKSYEAEQACEATNGHEISPGVKKIRPGISSAIIDEEACHGQDI